MNIIQLLEDRHTIRLRWEEVFPARTVDGNYIEEVVEIRATVHQCVNIGRRTTTGDDQRVLAAFVVQHLAQVVGD